MELLADLDGDSFSNLEESIAGTDPRDGSSQPSLIANIIQDDSGQIRLSFQSLQGKHYTVSNSLDLANYTAIHPAWLGDNAERIIQIQTEGTAQTTSPIRLQYWGNLSATSIQDLYDLETYPNSPDGSTCIQSADAPQLGAAGYGARMTLWFEPPNDGDYTFFLSSGGPAELYLHAREGLKSSSEKVAEILPAQTGLGPQEWETYGSQRSALQALEAESRYLLDLRFVSIISRQHAQLAWSGPGIDGIQPVSMEHLAPIYFHTSTRTGATLLEHDYDSSGQTGKLWPNITDIDDYVGGLSGNAERTNRVAGSNSDKRLSIGAGTNKHLYATWIFKMGEGAQSNYLLFMNGSKNDQEGPRMRIGSTSNERAVVQAGGPKADEARFDIKFDQAYRIELVTSLDSEVFFEYGTPGEVLTVAEDTFDIYVSDLSGNLVGSHRGLSFRDGSGVESISTLDLDTVTSSDITFDNWEITDGLIQGNGYLVANTRDFGEGESTNFFKLSIEEHDQDGDSIADWEELALAPYYPFHFFDPKTTNGTPDADALSALLSGEPGEIEVALYATDAAAFERNYPNTIPDDGEITITRTGPLTPVTVTLCIAPLVETGNTATVCDGTCCMLIGSAGDEEAEREDYELIDESGNRITDTVHFEFGETSKVLTLKAVDDAINEYPETVNLAIATSTDGSYTISETQNGASIQLFDLPDNPDNLTIFTGTFRQDGAATTTTSGSGFITATLNGPRTELRIWSEFSSLTSAQQDAHVHKAGPGPTPGNIIYAITQTPGDAETEPLNGQLTDYPWDISDSSGAVPSAGGSASKQTIIDSLFGQNEETPLYLNIHTFDNPNGEIWAFFGISGGSAEDPGDATAAASPGSAEYPKLSGDMLEAEVRRFLNQATFGATDAEANTLISKINQARLTDSDYHRNDAFADWINDQMNTVDQTYLLDYTLASHFQYMTLAGMFDEALNPSSIDWSTPNKPDSWPTINRNHNNPEYWHLSKQYPITLKDRNLALHNNIRAEPNYIQRRQAHWQLMINAHDQLRQKMGYALQQIVVVSDALPTVRDTPYGSANYQDMLNTHAFSHYRDVLGFVNWSPVMGKWLSSLQNQKAIDFDGDGLYDTFPDENLARENMQLFSIGLFEIWPDGSLKLSSEGLPSATYTNDDIQEFAKVLTGQSFSRYHGNNQPWGGVEYIKQSENYDFHAKQRSRKLLGSAYKYPMKMFGDYHSLGIKTFAGTTIDNRHLTNITKQAIADVEAAIDWLAGKPNDGLPDYDMVNSHVSTPAFISRRLIQRFTTSNPSKDYLHRVATVFKNSEGDLGKTLRAILLDPEARNLDLNDTTFGIKKSPLEGYVQLLRSLEAMTYIPLIDPEGSAPFDQAPGDYSNKEIYLDTFSYPESQIDNHTNNVRFMPRSSITTKTSGLQMEPFSQETVFNYYLPDYAPTGAISEAGLVAPELQLANQPDIIRNINYFEEIIRSPLGPDADELGGSEANQIQAFDDINSSKNNRTRLDRQALADSFYPNVKPEPIGRSSESIADEALLDALDLRLTNGLFKMRYPYNPSDDEDEGGKNPREMIIDAITNAYDDPYDDSNDESDRLYKFADALYLLTLSPEYQIKK